MLNVPAKISSARMRARARRLREPQALGRELLERARVGIEDDRHREAVVEREREADVDALVLDHAVLVEAGVDARMLAQRARAGHRDHVRERGAVPPPLLSARRSSRRPVVGTSRCSVNCGTTALTLIERTVPRRSPVSSTRRPAPRAASVTPSTYLTHSRDGRRRSCGLQR